MLRAKDASPNQNAVDSNVACATTHDAPVGDTTPPTVGALTAASASPTAIALAWGAAADAGGLQSIEVHQGTAGFAMPGTVIHSFTTALTTTTSHMATGLATGTEACFRLLVRDQAGLTAVSNPACATPQPGPDTTPPVAPGGVGATAQGASVVLSWGTVSDASMPVSYRVHRSTLPGVTTASPLLPAAASCSPTLCTLTDTNVALGTRYFYRVLAVDAAPTPNVGPLSAEVSVLMPAPQPGQQPQVAPYAGSSLVADAGPGKTVKPGEAVTLDGTGGDGASAARHEWTQVSGAPIAALASGEPVLRFTAPPQAGTLVFRLTIHDARGGSASDEVTVTVATPAAAGPTAAPPPAPTPPPAGPLAAALAVPGGDALSVPFSAPEAVAGSTYRWDFGDGQTSVEASPTHTYAAPGTYDVRLTVTDASGAERSFGDQVTVQAAGGTLPGDKEAETEQGTVAVESPFPWTAVLVAGAAVVLVAGAATTALLLRRRAAAAAASSAASGASAAGAAGETAGGMAWDGPAAEPESPPDLA